MGSRGGKGEAKGRAESTIWEVIGEDIEAGVACIGGEGGQEGARAPVAGWGEVMKAARRAERLSRGEENGQGRTRGLRGRDGPRLIGRQEDSGESM